MPSGHGTVVVSRLSRIEEVDDGACELLGYSRAELLAMHGADLVPPEERPAVAVSLDGMRRGTISERPGRLLRKDGTTIAVTVHAHLREDGRLELRLRATD
jgi:PAS domain S-box-containing protein